MKQSLPMFRYHPDPVATGAFEVSPGRCTYCGVDRTYVYVGPIFAIDAPDRPCPRCIADGSFAARFDAEFTDPAPLADLDAEIIDEVTRRTPGFWGWQGERWMTHCNDAAAFLGKVGYAELLGHPQALESLRWELAEDELQGMSKNGSLIGYLFACRHCAVELANWDMD